SPVCSDSQLMQALASSSAASSHGNRHYGGTPDECRSDFTASLPRATHGGLATVHGALGCATWARRRVGAGGPRRGFVVLSAHFANHCPLLRTVAVGTAVAAVPHRGSKHRDRAQPVAHVRGLVALGRSGHPPRRRHRPKPPI